MVAFALWSRCTGSLSSSLETCCAFSAVPRVAMCTRFEERMSHGVPRALHAVAELGIADALGETPRSAEDLARDTGTHAGALARTLRVLSAEGIFESLSGAWGHTPASRLLRSDHPQSMRSFVRMIGLSVYWRGFEFFADSLKT